MAGGTLVISREVRNQAHHKKRLEALGFTDVTVTSAEKDALFSLVRNLRPSLIIMGARFLDNCTPYLLGDLKKTFPKIKMAAVVIGHYPPDIAMNFYVNGGNSYVTSFDGVDQFYDGLEQIRKGKEYLSPSAQESLDMRREYPLPPGTFTDRQSQVLLYSSSGWRDLEIANRLSLSRRTVDNHKTDVFTAFGVRNPAELAISTLTMDVFKLEQLQERPPGYTLNPQPEKNIKRIWE